MEKIIRNVSILFLCNDSKKVLLQHRANDASHLPGYWAFFGGGIELNEDALKALEREITEELNYRVSQTKPVMMQKFRVL